MSVLWGYISPSRIGEPARPKGKAAQALDKTGLQRVLELYCQLKFTLFAIAIACPGFDGYDTSTAILFDQHRGGFNSSFAYVVEHMVRKLTRWDTIYFISSATRGYVYEQERAFSSFMSSLTSFVARVFFSYLPLSSVVKSALAGILISVVSNLMATIVLYKLVHFLTPANDARKRQMAFTTACLHIISPAGIFLLAGYHESAFALLSFLGLYCYISAIDNRFSNYADAYQIDAVYTISAGFWFTLATMVRSNGLLSGLVFAWDAAAMVQDLPAALRVRDTERLARFLATLIAGSLIAVGYVSPQVHGYMEFCTAGNTRPWCDQMPPSIYSFVQSHYWDVGFLRYWKVSNLPLFALTFPIGWLMVETTFPSLFQVHHINRVLHGSTKADEKLQPYPPIPATRAEKVFQHCLPRFALPQLVIVALAATTFHCQILNRISSAYPVWYFIIAAEICLMDWEGGASPRVEKQVRRGGGDERKATKGMFRLFGNYDRIPFARPEWIARGFVVYAVVQAGLYGAFLPPA
ncbi:ER membrane glycoprotein subunit of the GPI transamidase complex-like protein [Recurvomyces mirabilis]|uniref:GPI mannosyltransferase 2 n=1 Tax=Recurvomyces mirabilis TaxID=574656 RepID=A0AAE1C2U1_9PEZI|nr:ER membrane glycoprotein subunit of the GPI transamidase complex-like protein [Recurvomyces mirabilis]KAK5153635.1 ER membrane glycoprotein subunit of the GPI transamidase complex-like protein [Recurvomyces mirabilis]